MNTYYQSQGAEKILAGNKVDEEKNNIKGKK